MSKKEKLLKHILELFGYEEDNGGHSSGSAVRFVNRNTGRDIGLHRPHPGNEIKRYVKKSVREHLEAEGYL